MHTFQTDTVPPHTEVLIVGAGPTGLTLACDLARRGVRALLVEKADRLFPGSRGKGLQPRTLEVFDDLGVIDAILAAGARYPLMASWKGAVKGAEWDLIDHRPATTGVPYPDSWMVPQWRTQEILHARLLELGGRVEFGTALTRLEQSAERVEAVLERADGSVRRITADYLVAADGGRSTVRRAVGIPMTGQVIDSRPALVADLRLEGLDRDNWHVWRKAPGGMALLCPLPHIGQFQLFASFELGTPDTTPEGVRRTVAERTHLPAEAVTEVLWASEFRARAALAERLREGRVLLAGDAAHIHSPAGGQGLNTGVQDAYNLGWRLGQVIGHGAAPELLDGYEQERLPIAAHVLDLSTRLHHATGAGRTGDQPTVRRGAATDQLSVGYRGGPLSVERRGPLPSDTLQAGDRAPDAICTRPDGSAYRLFDILRGPHFTLVSAGSEPPAVPPAVRTHRADTYGEGLFLIRPDGHIALATHDPADITALLPTLGLDHPALQATARR
ncbi:FAD-dependent monooxygenase [Kitasatospora sp. GP82]|uniref:FAD-dependent monooxygenase n=1 Tax=Kitasatospora sp. GP82 TaxID=3035089 RepID=UPI002472F736|nr:FAD-dependent monooxygenase [Kitasatospora sp. GP82]